MKIHGERDGTRALIEVLLLGRHMAHEHVVAGLAAALRSGAMTADAVALEARKAAQAETEPAPDAQTLGDGDVPARVAPGASSAGHQAASLGVSLRPVAPTPPHQRQRPP
ncbi:hypothetical protein ACWDF9_25165 [Streptomyces rubiginosohelvolus]